MSSIQITAAKAPQTAVKPPRKHVRTRPQLARIETLDGRSNAAKHYRSIVAGIERDLGGELTTIQQHLAQAFACASVLAQHLSTKMANGEADVDMGALANALSAMVRISAKLGISKRAAPSEPSLSDYLATLSKADVPADAEGAS